MATIGGDPRYQEQTHEDLPLPESLLSLPSFLMLQILRAGRRAAEASPGGPRLPFLSVLACLEEYGPQSQRDVAHRLRWDPSDLVGVIDRLEQDGLVVRRRDPADRRRYALGLTRRGRAWVRSELAESETGIAGHLLSPLAAEERAQLTDLLRRVLAGLDPRVPAVPTRTARASGRRRRA